MAKAKKQDEALAVYDEDLAKFAEQFADQEANTGGNQNKISTRGGTLSVNGSPIPGDEMAVVVLDALIHNGLYEGDFDPDNPRSPTCYAYGRDEKTMAPHPDSPNPRHTDCASCPFNQYGSAEKGRGKACKNTRTMAVIAAGEITEDGTFNPLDEAELVKGDVYTLSVPPTSLTSYANYAKQLKASLRLPPFAVFTKISLIKNPDTQHKILFELIEEAPREVAKTSLLELHQQQEELLVRAYPKNDDGAEAAEQPARRKAAPRTQAPARQAAPTRSPAPARAAAPAATKAPARQAAPAAPKAPARGVPARPVTSRTAKF